MTYKTEFDHTKKEGEEGHHGQRKKFDKGTPFGQKKPTNEGDDEGFELVRNDQRKPKKNFRSNLYCTCIHPA